MIACSTSFRDMHLLPTCLLCDRNVCTGAGFGRHPFFLRFSFRWDKSILHDSAGRIRRHQYSWVAHLPPWAVPPSDRWFHPLCTPFCTWGELAQPKRSTRRRIFCACKSH